MQKSSWNRFVKQTALVLLLTASVPVGLAESTIKASDYCEKGRQARRLSAFFSEKIPRPRHGTPLDNALELQQSWVEQFRAEAHQYFRKHPTKELRQLMQEYTLLIPQEIQTQYQIGELIGPIGISTAVKYRQYLWKEYLEIFSTVKEAPHRNPDTLRFEVSLDLNLFCRYRQRVQDLVTR